MYNIKNEFIRNIIWGYISKIVSLLMPFAFRTVVIYKLGAEYLGLDSLFVSLLQVLSLSELGFSQAVVYSMYKPAADKDYVKISSLLSYYRRIYRFVGIAIFTIGLVIIPFLDRLIKGQVPEGINIYYAYTFFLLNTVVSYLLYAYKSSILLSFKRNDIESKIATIASLLKYVLGIVVIIFFENYYLYLSVVVLATIVNNFSINYITQKLYPFCLCNGVLEEYEVSKIKGNVYAIMFHKIGGIVLNSIDVVFISMYLGLVAVASYSNYVTVILGIESIIVICFTNITSIIGNKIVIEDDKSNTATFKKVFFFNGFVVYICSVLFYVLVQDFVGIWIGKSYLLSDDVILLLFFYLFIHMIRRTIIMYRDASGMWRDNMFQPILSAVVKVSSALVLVEHFGILAFPVSSLISMLLIDIPWEFRFLTVSNIKVSKSSYMCDLGLFMGLSSFMALLMKYALSDFMIGNFYLLTIKGVLLLTIAVIVWCLAMKNRHEINVLYSKFNF